jgi:hypothetical protein
MFKRRTLFICGAGTSFEAGLSLGVDLAENIVKMTDIRFGHDGHEHIGGGDYDLYDDIKQHVRLTNEDHRRAALIIRNGLGFSQSIDDFLDQHRTNERVTFYGKAALVKSILEAEADSKLYIDANKAQRFNADQVRGTWFVKFMYMLGRGIPKEDVSQIFDNVAFIVFNYDRCIEHFLFHALQRAYNISDTEAWSLLDDLTIIHPYGDIGPVRQIPFGAKTVNCAQLASRIRTYTEQEATGNVSQEIAVEVARAQCMIFLGFAYHPQNVRLLQPDDKMSARPIYGTAYKMSDSDVGIINRQFLDFIESQGVLATIHQNLIKLENRLTCADLFDYYARSLSGD